MNNVDIKKIQMKKMGNILLIPFLVDILHNIQRQTKNNNKNMTLILIIKALVMKLNSNVSPIIMIKIKIIKLIAEPKNAILLIKYSFQ